jgi:hypothetical protein
MPSARRATPLLLALLSPLLAASQSCDASSFPVATPDLQCFGLSPSPTASSADECVAACCALGASACAMWQYCAEGGGCYPQAYPCWLGQPTHDNYGGGGVCRNASGWTGGLRATPPAVGQYYALVPIDPASGLPLAGSLRHCDSIASMDAYSPGSPDFEWKVVEALSGDASAISLQPVNYFFDALGIRPYDARNPFNLTGISSAAQGAPLRDLAWRVGPGVQNSNYFSLSTTSANPAFAGMVLSVTSNPAAPCTYNKPRGDAVLAPPGAALAGNGTVLTQTFTFVTLAVTEDALWTTDHHDNQNSGYSAWDGPGEAQKVCQEQMIKDDPLAAGDDGTRFFSSGITSAVDGWWFGGDSSDTLHMLEDLLVAQQNDERDRTSVV